jgi:hypothetical protein
MANQPIIPPTANGILSQILPDGNDGLSMQITETRHSILPPVGSGAGGGSVTTGRPI